MQIHFFENIFMSLFSPVLNTVESAFLIWYKLYAQSSL